MGSERLHLVLACGQSDRLVLGDLTVIDDIEDGVPAKPAAFALVTALALCAVVKPARDEVRLWTAHVAKLMAAKDM